MKKHAIVKVKVQPLVATKNLLAQIDMGMHALKKATELSQVINIRNVAEALRAAVKTIGGGLEAHNAAAVLKIYSECKAGEMISKNPDIKRGQPKKVNHDHPGLLLRDLNISHSQSQDWQNAVMVPRNELDNYFERCNEQEREITSSHVIAWGRSIKSIINPPLPKGSYDVIYADPPWKYDFAPTYSRKVEKQYPTMELEDIKNLLIKTGKNAVLYLWATAPKLIEALEVIKAWGFTYKTNMIWDKEIIGMGYWFRGQHELLLVATKGKVPPPITSKRTSSVYTERRTQHSKKPDGIRKLIEKWHPNQKRIELFSRKKYKGWTVWGSEVKDEAT